MWSWTVVAVGLLASSASAPAQEIPPDDPAAYALFAGEEVRLGSRVRVYGRVGANGVGPFNAGHDIVSLTAAYELASGVSIDGVLQYARYRSRDAAGPDYQGLSAGLGTYIAF